MSIFRAGGFCFASSIGSDAAVFWCPRQCQHVLPVMAQRAAGTGDIVLDLATISCRVSILVTADGRQHVLFEERGRTLQLTVLGASLRKPVRLSSTVLWPSEEVKTRLYGLECLNGLRSGGRLPARFYPAEPRRSRLRDVLHALDASIAGAPHREIAAAVYGTSRVERDWGDPRDHLRDMVRRAIKRGRLLMNGGYKQSLL
ncbi:hypothetical protein ORS3428_22950 [Mesorhizobium sp. ORS 3428]|nr:hypothetical protein ORS3428_22950 [Mesorhizobium sp. ORS 3428]